MIVRIASASNASLDEVEDFSRFEATSPIGFDWSGGENDWGTADTDRKHVWIHVEWLRRAGLSPRIFSKVMSDSALSSHQPAG